jgi:hypothetical protein
MKFFGLTSPLFEEAIGDLGGGGGTGDPGTAIATIPAGGDTTPAADAPAASGEPGAAVAKFTGQLFTEDNKVNPAARPIMEALRRDHPVFENRLRAVLHENRNLRAEFPGGITEVRERMASLQRIIDDFGGEDAVTEARGELEFFHNLDQQFTAGDPRFIKAMIDAPGGQEAFLKLAPSMMAEYERLWPEGFQSFVDGKLLDRLRSADFRVNLERLADFLVQLPEGAARENAASYWVAIRDFYNALTASTKNKPAMPASSTPAPVTDNRGSDLDAREAAIKKREFGTAGSSEINNEFARQWKVLAKGTTAIQSHIRPAFDQRMKAALQADKSVDKAIQGYFSRNDVEGYRSYMRTQYQKHAARILKAELGHYRTGAVAAASAAGAPAPVAGAAPVPVRTEAGWTALNRRLTAQEYGNIDLEKTNRQMMSEGKAIMKNGTKVTFKR